MRVRTGETGVAGIGTAAAELRAYLESVVPAYRAEWGDGRSFVAALAWQRLLADGGWAAPSWPVWAGGRGLEVVDRVQCDAELARVDAPMPAGVLGLNNVGPALILFGDTGQRESLPRILRGEEIWCQGFSEPEAGSDLAGLRTRAELVGDDGAAGFVVNGQKVWTSAGMQGTHLMLLVRTDPAAPKHRGISVLLVPMDSAGIERRPLRQITGESEFAEVFFTDVQVPRTALLGPLHGGWRVTMATLGYERSGVLSLAAGLQREVERLVPGLRVSDPLLREEILRRWMDARLTGLLGARALAALGEGGKPGAAQSVIKAAWSRTTAELGETLLRVQGADGLLAGNPAAQRFLRSRSSTIAAGTTEIMKNLLAEQVLGLPKG
ncbi:acyl-CoA dehydrogenase family protein [Amycolatopsis ultiminotia]|uniref:Acyl-CoA dehydrogenase family protein n=1 Tax=Amycolatopsis ultiminotia TaxID=543629 RepID=A0ABP6V4P6_9PSEU